MSSLFCNKQFKQKDIKKQIAIKIQISFSVLVEVIVMNVIHFFKRNFKFYILPL